MKYAWIVGQVFPEDRIAEKWRFTKEWEIQGVFDSESKALKCVDDYIGDCLFIGRTELNVPLPIDSCEWQLSWFPKLEDKPDGRT